MTKEEALRFTESKWYEGRSAEDIVALQLYEERLCVPEFSIFHEAMETALKRPVQTLEFGMITDSLKAEFEASVPNAQSLIEKMQAEKEKYISALNSNKLFHYHQRIREITEDYEMFSYYASSDFQCDQTGGFPTRLCVCYEKGVAWLELNENLITDTDKIDLDHYRQLCADFGIRSCHDNEQFNELLKELGEDAYNTAYFPDEEEDMGMGGI